MTNRLTKYLRVTQQLIEEGRDAVSSKELGDFTGINPVQVRRDLNAIGFSGTRGVGYQAYDLVEAVRNILGLRQTYNIALVGAGNLGSAIAASTILPKRGFVIHDDYGPHRRVGFSDHAGEGSTRGIMSHYSCSSRSSALAMAADNNRTAH